MASLTSFEVLSNGPEMYPSRDLPSNTGPQAPGSEGICSAIFSAMCENRVEELSSHMASLMEENNFLKEKLKQSSEVLRDQLNAITVWNKQMVEMKKNHAKKVEDAVKSCQEIQSEKNEIMEKFEQLKMAQELSGAQRQCLEEEFNKLREELKNVITEKERVSKELQEKCTFQEVLQTSVNSASEEMRYLQVSNKLLEEEKRELSALNTDLLNQVAKSTHNTEENSATIFNDEESGYAIVFQDNQVEKNDEYQTKSLLLELQKLHGKLSIVSEELGKEEAKVDAQNEMLRKKDEQIEALDRMNKLLASRAEANVIDQGKLRALQFQLLGSSEALEDYKNRCMSQQKMFDDHKMCMTMETERLKMSMTADTEHLKEELEQKEREKEDMKKQLEELERQFLYVTTEYERSVVRLFSKDSSQTQNSAEHQEHIDMLTAKLASVEEENKKIERLDREKAEMIEMLKTQVNLYKFDFDTERASSENAQEEIEMLRKQIRTLQESLQNQEQSREKKSGFFPSSRSHGESRSRRSKF